MKKKLSWLVQVCLTLLLTGCIEFTEVTQLRPDGGVDFNLTVLLPERVGEVDGEKNKEADRELEEIFRRFGASVKLQGRGEEALYGKQRFWISASLPSLSSVGDIFSGFEKASAKEKAADLKKGREALGSIFSERNAYRVEKTKRGTLKIVREFKPGKDSKKKDKGEYKPKEAEELIMNSMTFRFEFFSPTEVLSSNATGKFGQALRWEASLGHLSKNPFKIELEIASTPELEAALLGP